MNNMIFKKMSEVMKEIGFIAKDQKNAAQGFKFRGIDQFINALYPALVKHGVFMTPECVSETHELKEVVRSSGKVGVDKHVYVQMKYHFYAEDGSTVSVGPVPAEGLDSSDKATNKALSSALKYALIQTFSVPTEDMTPDADFTSPEMGTKVVSKPVAVIGPVINPNATVTVVTATNPPKPLEDAIGTPVETKKPTFKKPPVAQIVPPVAVSTNGESPDGWE